MTILRRSRADGQQPVANFVLGVDLDGVCADFYDRMRDIVAEWKGVDRESLPEDFRYGLAAWGVDQDAKEYPRIHRFAVTQRDLFRTMSPIAGSPQALRRLSTEGVHIRIITHRLFIPFFHQVAVAQTVEWLDNHGIPYSDLCFMEDKALVDADVYIEDTEKNIRALEACRRTVITYTNPTNVVMDPPPALRADNWQTVEAMVRERYYAKLKRQGRRIPSAPGRPPHVVTP